MFIRSGLAPGMVFAALLPFCASASPITLSAAKFEINMAPQGQGTNQQFTAPGTYRAGNLTTTVTGLPGASIRSHSVGTPYDGSSPIYTSQFTDLTYYFAVDGPTAGIVVPMIVGVTWNLSSSGVPFEGEDPLRPVNVGSGAVSFYVTGAGDAGGVSVIARQDSSPVAVPSECRGLPQGLPCPGSDFSGLLPFFVASGTINTAFMELVLGTKYAGIADGFIDPYIYIDPNFLQNNPGYSVVVSTGIGNEPAVVPAPVSLLLLGTGLVTLAARRWCKARVTGGVNGA